MFLSNVFISSAKSEALLDNSTASEDSSHFSSFIKPDIASDSLITSCRGTNKTPFTERPDYYEKIFIALLLFRDCIKWYNNVELSYHIVFYCIVTWDCESSSTCLLRVSSASVRDEPGSVLEERTLLLLLIQAETCRDSGVWDKSASGNICPSQQATILRYIYQLITNNLIMHLN